MSYWRDKNVFVTGCTGLLGTHLCELLLDKGANVIGLVRDYVPKSRLFTEQLKQRIIVVNGNVENYMLLERAISEYEIDTVFHLAAQTIVSTATKNPLSTFDTNIRGTWNLLEACRRNQGVERIILASSDKAYGEHKHLPYKEEAPLQGRHPYDVSKSCADLIAQMYSYTYDQPVCVTRCGNFYGPGDLNFNRLVPGTIRSALQGESPVIRSDGTYIRDYFYVKDGAEAYLFLAQKMDEIPIHGEAFNFSNELQITVIELVNKILSLMGCSHLHPVIKNTASKEIRHQYLSTEKAKKILGWQPQYPLEQALKDTIEWYCEQFPGGEAR
ncbi:GDP-mannose 4,6-dehydratase [Pelotomaculum propionicicum]|uniref:CDP-glucose 4,6-dehydratase n=1 Tax=Pelotomaculum propionicicum TaxID=258475 RepID=A0A4Y7RUN3_9FIRM|nr:GDP-mannose 4,6-dehydratase [Pelotomaculum propionicicum]NLI14040.1 NAD-dependent epimerase/dehydratase family protein [Peptococcaceae bacterium]TEB12591.1 CDP-glucose 4,6-dehydratase [Pelotomaculum propionicicum]